MIYYIFSIFTAILVATMIVANGGLSSIYGAYLSTVMIHAIGLVTISIVCLIKQKKVFQDKLPFVLHLGGAIGYASTISNNLAFNKLSVSAIIALGLFAQSLTALLIDHYGLFHMPKQPLQKSRIIGTLFTMSGIAYMLSESKFLIVPIVLSCLAGISIILSRTINAQLADQSNIYASTWYNFFTGMMASIVFLFILGREDIANFPLSISFKPWIYLGGIIGMIVVLLSNLCVTKISAFYMTLIMFVGQILTGIAFDIILTNTFSIRNLIGGMVVALGLSLDILLSKLKVKQWN